MKQNIHEMRLHETILINNKSTRVIQFVIIRVPGGWLYKVTPDEHYCFVPYNSEFQWESDHAE